MKDTCMNYGKLDEFLDEMMALNDLPGLAVGVSIGGICGGPAIAGFSEHVGTRGYRDFRNRILLEEEDIFHCASVSKLFTATAIMKLVEAGAFGLYDRVCDLLPLLDLKDKRFREVRLWNLLTHTSGLGDVSDYQWYCHETGEDALHRYVYGSDEVISQPMLWYPRVSPEFYGVPETDENGNLITDENGKPFGLFRYSNIAFEILGEIVAEYSDRIPHSGSDHKLSYEDFIRRYLLEPSGMVNTTMKTFERCDFNSASERDACFMASPHMKDDNRSIVPVEFYPYNRCHAPSSTLTSNVPDLLKWGRAHMKAALRSETYDSIWREYTTVPNNGEKMGLGWFMRKQSVNDRDYVLYGHEGTDDGFRASFWICPELELVTVVLSNLSGAPVKKINRKLFSIICR